MRTDTPALQQWLQRLEQLHTSAIELGLERCGKVYCALQLELPIVITVGGTNGKGSTCAMLEAILLAAGYRVGLYTSPHIWHYCERVRVNGRAISDEAMIQAFEAVETVRDDTPLTYFEFGTLAAFQHFASAQLDVIILEVGMGGRLDTVNLVDADVAIVTNVSLDHQAFLGNDRDSIAAEKAGIYRRGRPAVFGEPDVPASVNKKARALGLPFFVAQRDYHWESDPKDQQIWYYRGPQAVSVDASLAVPRKLNLPVPNLLGQHQLANAAAAITALGLIQAKLAVAEQAIVQGLQQAQMIGRLQRSSVQNEAGQEISVLLDVAHNDASVASLVQYLQQRKNTNGLKQSSARVLLIFSALNDKDLVAMANALKSVADEWYIAPVEGPRASSNTELQQALSSAGVEARAHALQSIPEAIIAATNAAQATDYIVVCGSFLTVASAVKALDLEHGN